MASPTRIIYDTMRGGPSPPRVEHADSDSPYVLIEIAVPPDAEQVRLSVHGEQSSLTPSAEGFVSFLIDRRELAAADRPQVSYHQKSAAGARTLTLEPVSQ